MNTNMTRHIISLDRLTPDDADRAGAKAYNCGRLKQAGFRVPDGLAVLATATPDEVARIGEHEWFDGIPEDTLFAVRSSGIGEDSGGESFAGIHQTMLNVRRADLGQAVAACQASARSTQALAYRKAKGLSLDAIHIGVLIQCMVQPTSSGVAFTINPVTGADTELVINASWGLGEALVSGLVDPDEFVVRKRDGALQWSRIGEKGRDGCSAASLSVDQVRELGTIAADIERHYGMPQDVEWCHDGSVFWIVQSRPVTAGRAQPDETEWTRANLAEVLPDLTSPQALAVVEELLNRAERQYLGTLVAPDDELGPLVKSFCGRLHFNLSQMRRVCAIGGMAPADMLRSMGHAEAIQPGDEVSPRPTLGQLSNAPALIRIVLRHLRAAHIVRHHEHETRKHVDRFTAVDPRGLSDERVWSTIEQWFIEAPNLMQSVLLLSGVSFHEGPVRRVCEKVGVPFEQLVYPQLAAGERSVSAQQAFDLVALADTARGEPAVVRFLSDDEADLSQVRTALRGTAFLVAFERFLEQYGHRGRYEYDWSLPRYGEDPTPLLRALRAHLDAGPRLEGTATQQLRQREASDAWKAFEQRLSRWQRWTTLPGTRRSVRRIKQYYVWREQVRSNVVRVLTAMRGWHLVLADRFAQRKWVDQRDDYFLLRFEEIASTINGHLASEGLRRIAAERAREQARHRALQMPLLMRESELPTLIRAAALRGGWKADVGELTGQTVSPGCVEGEVVVVRDPGDFDLMKRGAILVAPASDPSWTPLFTLASGVIVEIGGVLSHASTIAREYGLPALANVKHATNYFTTGDRVRLDATNGLVCRLQRASVDREPHPVVSAS